MMNRHSRSLFLAVAMICSIFCYPRAALSQESECSTKPNAADYETLAMFTANQGMAQLLLHNYSFALDELQRAEALLERSNEASPETEFLIRFGQAVAFDNLGNQAQANRMIELMNQKFQECEPSDDLQMNTDIAEEMQAVDLMQQIALLAPSDDVKARLLSFFESAHCEMICCHANNHSDYEANKHSSHVWKKVKKICKEILIRAIAKYVEDWLSSHTSK